MVHPLPSSFPYPLPTPWRTRFATICCVSASASNASSQSTIAWKNSFQLISSSSLTFEIRSQSFSYISTKTRRLGSRFTAKSWRIAWTATWVGSFFVIGFLHQGFQNQESQRDAAYDDGSFDDVVKGQAVRAGAAIGTRLSSWHRNPISLADI